jgi:DNA invertase Pin-like site-specific DNA recombinase
MPCWCGRSLGSVAEAFGQRTSGPLRLRFAFISFRDNLDLSTPSERLMFEIIGAMAEFERSLIQERVRAGLRNARAKGKKFGRSRAHVDADRVAALRREGLSWSQVCRMQSVSKGSAQRFGCTTWGLA